MRVKVIWPQPIWLNGSEVKNWEEIDIDEETAKMLESKKMVVIMDAQPVERKKREPRSPA